MAQTRDEIDQTLAERLCWQAARRDDSRVARRLYRKPSSTGLTSWTKGPCWMTSSTSCTSSVWSTGCTTSAVQRSSVKWCRWFSMSCSIA